MAAPRTLRESGVPSRRVRWSSAAPEVAVGRDELGFQFRERADDLDLLLAGAQHRAAGQVHGRVLRTVAGKRQQRELLSAVDQAGRCFVRPSLALVRSSLEICHRHVSLASLTVPHPINCAGAHGARLEGRDQCAAPEKVAVVFDGGAAGEFRLGVADRIDVALAHQDRVVGTDEHRAEGMMALCRCFTRDGVGGAEVARRVIRIAAGMRGATTTLRPPYCSESRNVRRRTATCSRT